MRLPMTLRNQRLSLCCLAVFSISTLAAAADFPSFNPDYPPPEDWQGRVFELSQDFPSEEPEPEDFPWEAINFQLEPFEYLRTVLSYSLEGNIEVDFDVQNNPIRTWYHAPWMHAGCGGREFVRGLTRERSSRPRELHPNQTGYTDNWAVGIYNPPGGYVLGQVWEDPAVPHPQAAVFPNGTVSIKLLFSAAPVEQVPYLEGSFTWEADIYPPLGRNPCGDSQPERPREIKELRLLQLDVSVRDERVPDTGWVFGTFIYDAGAAGETPWDRLQVVGVQWGNDPTVKSQMQDRGAFQNPDLQEGMINSSLILPEGIDEAGEHAFVTHFGLGGRVNGPIDNPISSCMSCHGLASVPSQSVVPRGAWPGNYPEDEFDHFFANTPPGTGDDPDRIQLDYSMQLAFGIRAFASCLRNPEREGCGPMDLGPIDEAPDGGDVVAGEIRTLDPRITAGEPLHRAGDDEYAEHPSDDDAAMTDGKASGPGSSEGPGDGEASEAGSKIPSLRWWILGLGALLLIWLLSRRR